MNTKNVSIVLTNELPSLILGAIDFPRKVYETGYINFDPFPPKRLSEGEVGESVTIDLDDPETRMAVMKEYAESQIEAKAILDTLPTTDGIEDLVKELSTLSEQPFRETMMGCGLRSLEVHFLHLYVRHAPAVDFANGKIVINNVNLRVAYHITAHGKCGPFRKHVDFKSQDNEIQSNVSVSLRREGAKIYADLDFDRLKLVFKKVFKFTFDIKELLNPKLKPVEVFDLSKFSQSIPGASDSLYIKDIEIVPSNGQISLDIQFATS
ncbi:MAG: hypothetical protein JAZ12_12135 [Candidatus Thiodiazotropha taylori]|nr:hypothetical protein [Candidatus Thiodiazotropha taylori]